MIRYILILLLVIVFLISACGIEQTAEIATETATSTTAPTITQTSIPPSATPIPMAVIINNEGITREEFDVELDRYLSATGSGDRIDSTSPENQVLENFISQTLLKQGAEKNGFEISGDQIDSRIQELVSEAGGEEDFNRWLTDNGYNLDSFKIALAKSILAAWIRDQILQDVPQSAEQVNIQQLFFLSGDQANQVFQELESGRDFATIAAELDPFARGELGWVPRNYLPHQEIEEVAFNLQPGEYSQVIETSVGYHVIRVLEFDQNRRLNPDARLVWQELALKDWINQQREASNIEVFALE
jgi:parvulin-like peptidyl-prolyl isomerase